MFSEGLWVLLSKFSVNKIISVKVNQSLLTNHTSGLDLIKKMDWTLRWQSTIKTNRKYIHSIK